MIPKIHKRFYPVVHVHDIHQCHINVDIASNIGVDGIFLINHGSISEEQFDSIIENVVLHYGDCLNIGVNFLGESDTVALQRATNLSCDMLWLDNANAEDEVKAKEFSKQRLVLMNHCDIFGGVHFKYQTHNLDINTSIKRTVGNMIFPTLSGPATGIPADLEFIKTAYEAADGVPLSIASGISSENVELYLPYIDNFLVASSIIDKTTGNEYFDEELVGKLCHKIDSWKI